MRINYPRDDRQGWLRFVPSWRLVLGSVLTLGLGLVAIGVLAFALAWVTIDVPEENEVAAAQTSIVYWSDGDSEMARLGDTNRISVPLSQVPEHVRHAVMAAEDRTFYEHNGFAVKGFLRAVWTNLTTGSSQGGSTITQQYAKNAFLSSDKTFIRKFKELVLSFKLEAQLSKDEILERYLNTIYFGRGAYGIQTASEAYFESDSTDLTLEQGAVLASIINAPGRFDPETHMDALQDRYAYVLNGMVEAGWLSGAERDQGLDDFPEIADRKANQRFAGPTGHLLRAIQDEVLAMGFTDAELEGGGLRIVSTFDRQAQEAAVEAVDEQGPTTGTEGLRIGLAAVEPVTGEVVALYGGADYLENSLNNATQAIAQAGSTFKPFGLAAATEDGIGLDSLWPGNSGTEISGYVVNNYGGTSYGDLTTLLRGTEQSINTVYVAVSDEVGPEAVKDAALRAGIPADTAGFEGPTDLTFVLGTDSPHTLDVAAAYATFAARGERAAPTVIRRIGTAEGGVLYERRNATVRTFDEGVCDVVNSALQRVVTNGTGGPARALGRPVAAKTGSTDEYLSAWFAGYTPQLAAAVSFSKDDEEGNPISLSGTGGMPRFFGSGFPARVWTAFMRGALDGEAVQDFVEPTDAPTGGGASPTSEPPEPSPSETSAEPSATAVPTETAPTLEPTPEPEPTETAPPETPPTAEPPPNPEPTQTAPPAEPAPAQPAPAQPAPAQTTAAGGRPPRSPGSGPASVGAGVDGASATPSPAEAELAAPVG